MENKFNFCHALKSVANSTKFSKICRIKKGKFRFYTIKEEPVQFKHDEIL